MIKQFFRRLCSQRLGLVSLLVSILVTISFFTRSALLIASAGQVEWSFYNIAQLYFLGLFYDLVNASYFIIPFVFYVWLMPSFIFNKAWHRYILYGIFFLDTFGLIFNASSEWFFRHHADRRPRRSGCRGPWRSSCDVTCGSGTPSRRDCRRENRTRAPLPPARRSSFLAIGRSPGPKGFQFAALRYSTIGPDAAR